MRPPTLFALLGVASLLTSTAPAAVEMKTESDKVTIAVGGRPFTEFHFAGAPHQYFYPLFGPGGAKMTRAWPMEEVPGEEHDHPHHRSLWFAHGDVNGIDFWTEPESFPPGKPSKMPQGRIVHDQLLKAEGGEREGTLQATSKWVAPDGSVPLTSSLAFRVLETGGEERVFDYVITLQAGEKEVKFGDTKEGTMALRVAESMRLKAGKGQPAGEGHMVSSEGLQDDKVWGTKAAWVDYSGPVGGKILGIAIFEHPKNLRHPTRWHARDYGLFAANPFCAHEMDKSQPEGSGALTLAPHESLTFRYRFLLHEGDAVQGKVAERFAEYQKQPVLETLQPSSPVPVGTSQK